MDINKAVKYLDDNAETGSTGRCAAYVRNALEAGGLKLTHHPFSAKDYGPTLLANGFTKFYEYKEIVKPVPSPSAAVTPAMPIATPIADTLIWAGTAPASLDVKGIIAISQSPAAPSADYVPKTGDVAVIQPYKGGDPNGHITMYDGEDWVSDFVQRDMWGGPGYRQNKPNCIIYRP